MSADFNIKIKNYPRASYFFSAAQRITVFTCICSACNAMHWSRNIRGRGVLRLLAQNGDITRHLDKRVIRYVDKSRHLISDNAKYIYIQCRGVWNKRHTHPVINERPVCFCFWHKCNNSSLTFRSLRHWFTTWAFTLIAIHCM